MSEVYFERAKLEDLDDIMDFSDFVFSHNSNPHDFMSLHPKLYKIENFMEGIHYLAREKGKIKAAAGAYPMKMEFSGGPSLPGRGIGMVCVHPRSRSKGYMKEIMNMALEDMKKDNMVFSCLGGQRQRYEYFNYSAAGANYYFFVQEANINHTLGREWKNSLHINIINSKDKNILDNIMELHEAKDARFYRSRDKLYDILTSWNSILFAITEENRFEGYFVCRADLRDIVEINLKNPSRICEAIGLLLRYRKEKNNQNSIHVIAGSHEEEKVMLLSRFAESCRQGTAYQFNVLDFKRFVEPLMKLKAKQRTLAEGSFILKINGPSDTVYELSSHGTNVEIKESNSPPGLILDPLEAVKFFFSPLSAILYPKIRESVFLQSLLPLPLFFENMDGV